MSVATKSALTAKNDGPASPWSFSSYSSWRLRIHRTRVDERLAEAKVAIIAAIAALSFL